MKLNLTGYVFGMLVAISQYGDKWLCKCLCGKSKLVAMRHLRSGGTKSCGCFQQTSRIKHGDGVTGARPSEYTTWDGIKQRCFNKNSRAFPYYGGRGITMSKEWLTYEGFLSYLLDTIGRKPGPAYSIDRIDNNGNYEPGNIRWATKKQQMNNTRKVLKKIK